MRDSFSDQNSVFTFDEPGEIDTQKENIRNSFRKMKIAERELRSFEKLLTNKEKLIESRSIQIAEDSEILAESRCELEKEKLLLLLDRQNFTKEKDEFFKFQSKFKDKLEKNKLKKHELKELIAKNQKAFLESQTCFEELKAFEKELKNEQESMKLSKQQIEAENKLVIKQINALAIKKVEFEKAEERQEMQKRLNEKEKSKLQKEREALHKLKKILMEERENLKNEIREAETARKQYEDCMEVQGDLQQTILQTPAALTRLFETLQMQIEVFNSEISLKENRLIEREEKLFRDSKKLSNVSKDLHAIEQSLKTCKTNLLKLQSVIVPEIKALYKASKEMLDSLCDKIQDITTISEKLVVDVNAIAEVKVMAAAHQENIDKHLSELQKKENDLRDLALNLEERQSNMSMISVYSDSRMDTTIVELEQNLKMLQDKQDEVDKEAEENAKNAQCLKAAILEIEDTKKKLLQERIRYKEKNNLLQAKQKQISERFKELETFHANLRKKEAELQNLQKQICNVEVLNKSIKN